MPTTDWERLARERPFSGIWAEFDGDIDRFWASGRGESAQILGHVRPWLHKQDTVLEIGCGVGRVLLPMSTHFARCIGVDISSTRLTQLQTFATRAGLGHQVVTYQPTDPWHTQQADLVYCVWVFRLLEETAIIADYLRKIAWSLTPDGVAYLQFDLRPRTFPYRVRRLVPDPVLPVQWRRGLRGVRRPRTAVQAMLARAGLLVLSQFVEDPANPRDEAFIVRRRSDAPPDMALASSSSWSTG